MLKYSLPYHHDSSRLFARIAHQPWAMFLDSGQLQNPATGKAGSQYGRYDILVAEPMAKFVTLGAQTIITADGKSEISLGDPFELLKNFLNRYPAPQAEIPFAGGAVGYFAYDLARRLEKLEDLKSPEPVPEMMVGIYDWAIVVDHRKQLSMLISNGFSNETHVKWKQLCALFEDSFLAIQTQFEVTCPIQSNFSETTYASAFKLVQQYIQAGDCYQVNLAQRFSTRVQGDSWIAYQLLRKVSPAPFMAYMQLPLDQSECFQIMSNSPERFIQSVDKHVETRPIKGTRPRSSDSEQDAAYSYELLTSIKDKAENLMIVDLLRNDIGKNCETGSVKADILFQLQSFTNVHHLVSIITGKLKQGATSIDLLKGCFPGGSITGAPKVRAMQIINEIEPHRRGIYCGAIGYIGFDGNMDTNIAIRTAVVSKGKLSFYAGGGIVSDSECEKEYVETLDKAASMTAILQYFMQK
ncbi:MAG: aminodeoxychorismate synthase component I [Methylophilaceae bacterium]